MANLVVIYITPSEQAKQVTFRGFPDYGDPWDYTRQIENLIGERSCAQPYFMAVFPEKDEIPVFCTNYGECLEPAVIELR